MRMATVGRWRRRASRFDEGMRVRLWPRISLKSGDRDRAWRRLRRFVPATEAREEDVQVWRLLSEPYLPGSEQSLRLLVRGAGTAWKFIPRDGNLYEFYGQTA